MTSIPPTGLQMTCEYCGLTQPVPDADKRRTRMEREAKRAAEQRKKAEERARRQAEREGQSRQQRRRSTASWLLTLPLKLLPLALVVGLFYYLGGYELFFGDDGAQALAQEISRLEADGYRAVGPPASERFVTGVSTFTVGMERGQCYAVAVGSGRPVRSLRLRTSTTAPNRARGSVVHCPPRSGASRVELVLGGPGRFSWALLRREAPRAPGPAVRAPVKAPARRRQRRRRRPRAAPPPPRPPAEGARGTGPPPVPPDPFESEIPLEP